MHSLRSATAPVIESLEQRSLFSAATIQPLPYVLDFSSDRGEVVDKDGQGTGFTRVQANKLGNEYQAGLIDLDTAAGVLKLTTTGTSSAGSYWNQDNTLVNLLETQFNGTTSGFKITTRLVGPLGYIAAPSEQGGISFGPDQDNYVKLVAVSSPDGQYIQFQDETDGANHQLNNVLVNVGSFSAISTLDLQLVGDAGAGTVTAYYSINNQGYQQIANVFYVPSANKSAFFNAASRAGIVACAKNDLAPITVTFDSFRIDAGSAIVNHPTITRTRPANGSTGLARNSFVAADVNLTSSGIDPDTVNFATVKLYRTSDHAAVGGVLNTSGAGDALVFTPGGLLDANTSYTFEVTSGLKDMNGVSFVPFSSTFTTGTAGPETDPSIAFDKVNLANTSGYVYTAVQVGPDGKLYAATDQGLIRRWSTNGDGTLGSVQDISSLTNAEGAPRLITGFAFDPASTSSNVILWVTHNQAVYYNADDWTGKISKLSGANLGTVTPVIVGLPRSVRDHLTNQPVFGPDGALYFAQGAMTAMGAPDAGWGYRSEHLLSAAVLRLDLTKLTSLPLNVKTEDGGTYNPYAANAPLTLYATGVRNAYDLVWASNGHLYAATNGSAAGGSTPAGPNNSPPALTSVQQTQPDFLFDIVKGGYYGAPNPTRGEYVMNGGNPTAAADFAEVSAYPVGTLPDPNYRGAAYIFGLNYSPNGFIQYKGSAFGGKLTGTLMVTEYSGGDDVIVLTPGADGTITKAQTGISGLTYFVDPLDIAQDTRNGNLYVAEYGGQTITLLSPVVEGGHAFMSANGLYFNDPANISGSSQPQKVTISNTGTSTLALPADAFSITGPNAAQFAITQKPALPASIAPGQSVDVWVNYTASAIAIQTATLTVKSNDAANPLMTVALRGLGTAGTGGSNEPSLQMLMNLFQIPINVGDPTPNTYDLPATPSTPNDEVVMPIMTKAGSGSVTIELLASFGVGQSGTPTTRFGWYDRTTPMDFSELFTLFGDTSQNSNSQSTRPNINGITSFDPGTAEFGLYAYWPSVPIKSTTYSADSLNTFDSALKRKIRFYPLKNTDGSVVPNAYIFAIEEYNGGYDNQDLVGIIRNVKGVPANLLGPEIGFQNTNGVSFGNQLTFNRIQNSDNSAASKPNNITHDLETLRIYNSGNSTLNISSIVASPEWTIEGAVPTSIAPGAYADVKVRFTANATTWDGHTITGTLTVNSNDPTKPAAMVNLFGWWQIHNEDNKEPDFQDIVKAFGFKTTIVGPNQTLSNGGRLERIGDEVLSPYWRSADTSMPVTIRQLAAYHTQGNTSQQWWYDQGSWSLNNLFTSDGDEGQSLLPHSNDPTSGVVGSNSASAQLYPSGAFGLRVDSEWSDPTRNGIPAGSTTDQGHHVRFWVARDTSGRIIPNTYIMAMDYQGINYDYNDNVYIVYNMKPTSAPTSPTGVNGSVSNGIAIDWNNNTEVNLAGYNVYRSSSSSGPWTKLNTNGLLTTSDYQDSGAPAGQTSYYKITAVDNVGNESGGGFANATRPADAIPPATPKGLTASAAVSGNTIAWSANSDSDLAGYNIYRANSAGGPFTKLNGSVLTGTSYFDGSAPVGSTSYYQIKAVDTSNNESVAASITALRPAPDTTAPANPSNFKSAVSPTSVVLSWNANSESDLTGYNVYRSATGTGSWTKLNTSGLLAGTTLTDSNVSVGQTWYYKVGAVDTSSNESSGSIISVLVKDSTPPAAPKSVTSFSTKTTVVLSWAANVEADLAGYNVYRATTISGPWTKLTSSLASDATFTDATASANAIYHYRISAVDLFGNESLMTTLSAKGPDTIAPVKPAALTTAHSTTQIIMDWASSTDTDFGGYNIYRSSSATTGFAKLNASPITDSNYSDRPAANKMWYYRISTVDKAGNESAYTTSSDYRPYSYTSVDIGGPKMPGSTTVISTGINYNITSAGVIGGTTDQLRMASRQVTGDFDIAVRVSALTNLGGAQAGLMARESTDGNAKNIFAFALNSKGYRLSSRSTTGGTTSTTGSGSTSYPNTWIRLKRVGNTFTAYRSIDGKSWTAYATKTMTMSATLHVGMAISSGISTSYATAQFRQMRWY
ncbi:MAG TPA: choice-of-anchor D domain-containing protein [Tepidisphaeraceae bacterium]